MKSNYFVQNNSVTWRELLICTFIIALAVYGLTPRNWMPGDESWKYWAAARILRDTGGWHVLSFGPAYVAYLIPYLSLDYPFSFQLEYFIAHIFCHISIFLLLRRVLPTSHALLLACAWIPIIAVAEGGAMVAGIGFFSLYLGNYWNTPATEKYLPNSLLAAVLCHNVYLFFLVGHLFGSFVHKEKRMITTNNFQYSAVKKWFFPLFLKSGLISVFTLAIIFPSSRWDHNHQMMDFRYAPQLEDSSSFTQAFFQIGNWKYVTANVPESEWSDQDWYFTNKKIYGGATTVLQAATNNPQLFFSNILTNIPSAILLPLYFYMGTTGATHSFIGLHTVGLSWCLFLIGIYMIGKHFKTKNIPAHIYSLTLGTVAVITAFLLTHFGARFKVALVPLGLLIVAHIAPSIFYITEILRDAIMDNSAQQRKTRRINNKHVGLFFMFVGFLANPWVFSYVNKIKVYFLLNPLLKVELIAINIIFIACGVVIILKPESFKKVAQLIFLQKTGLRYQFLLHSMNVIVPLIATSVLLLSFYPEFRNRELNYLFSSQHLLSKPESNSITEKLLLNVDKDTDVLTLDDIWLKAFANVNLNKVYNVFSLPPFPDSTGETEYFLNGLDVIMVGRNWSTESPSMSTQGNLRYRLHVAPFIKKALLKGWTVSDVPGYGKIYNRPSES